MIARLERALDALAHRYRRPGGTAAVAREDELLDWRVWGGGAQSVRGSVWHERGGSRVRRALRADVTSASLRLRCLRDAPTPDEQPQHEDEFAEERDEHESRVGVGIEVWLHAIADPAQSVDDQDHAEPPRDVARADDQKSDQYEVDSKKDQPERVIRTKRMEQQVHLRAERAGAEARDVFGLT